MRLLPPLALSVALLFPTLAEAEVPRVVATIKPIHSLVAAVMGHLGSPALIVKGGASPHTYSLKPSDAQALEAAGIVFWTGHGLELFLEDALDTLTASANVVELAEAPGIELLAIREGGPFEPHEDEAEKEAQEDHAGQSEPDMHFWLEPGNAKVMVDAIAAALSEADPENSAAYAANAAAAKADLDRLAAEIETSTAGIRSTPFIVFHDAYQYFERRFGLNDAGSITVTPHSMPGAQRIGELRDQIREVDARCVFAEPQFQPAIVAAIIEGTDARASELDPEGANLPEGPGLYRQLLENLAASLAECLGGGT